MANINTGNVKRKGNVRFWLENGTIWWVDEKEQRAGRRGVDATIAWLREWSQSIKAAKLRSRASSGGFYSPQELTEEERFIFDLAELCRIAKSEGTIEERIGLKVMPLSQGQHDEVVPLALGEIRRDANGNLLGKDYYEKRNVGVGAGAG